MSLSSVTKSVLNVVSMVSVVGPFIPQYLGYITLPAAWEVSGVLGAVMAVVHWLIPNTTTDPAIAATQSVKLVTPKATLGRDD